MTKTWCVGGRHCSNTVNENVHEKLNPKTKKLVKIKKEIVLSAVVINHKFLLSKRHEEKILLKKRNVRKIIVHLCQTEHGVIEIVKEI